MGRYGYGYGMPGPLARRAWSPLSLGSSLALWLRADLGITLNGATVSAWADQSGNGRHATQGAGVRQPTYRAGAHASAINGQPVVDFDATLGHHLAFGASAFAALTGGAEVFLIGRLLNDPASGAARSGIWAMGSAGGSLFAFSVDGSVRDDFGSTVQKNMGNPTASLASPFSYNVISVAGEFTGTINGTQQYTTATNTVGWNATPMLGQITGASWFYDGVMAEVVITDGKMTAGNRAALRAYLQSRYGVS